MEEILALTREIAFSIKESNIYKDYLEARQKVDNNPDLKKKIVDFKQKHVEFQSKRSKNEDVSFDEEKYVSRLYFDLMLNDEAKKYFDNEEVLLHLMGSIYKTLDEECRIDVDF